MISFVNTININFPRRNRFHTTKLCNVKLSLSGPHNQPGGHPPFRNDQNTFSSSQSLPINEGLNDFEGWSSDFIELCNAQLSLLMSATPQLEQVSIFFRKENPNTGALEFIPLIAHSSDKEDLTGRVWISSGVAGEIELENIGSSKILPGGIPAKWIVPDYPFTSVGKKGGILMPDGGLCIPIEYNQVLAGSIVLRPRKLVIGSGEVLHEWTNEEIERADTVAKTIALAAALEGKWRANINVVNTSRSLMSNLRTLLQTTLHQVRSPIQALITFGHLLRKKLPPGDSNRDLARNMILEAFRIDELLEPLDNAGARLVLPEAVSPTANNMRNAADIDEYFEKEQQSSTKEKNQRSILYKLGFGDETEGMQLMWLSDILQPQAEITSALAEDKEMTFIEQINDDSPPVHAVEKYVREAVSNLLNNSLKYSPSGSTFGLICGTNSKESDFEITEEDTVEVIVWDTGYGFTDADKEVIWRYGERGSAASKTENSGSGIGLALAKELLSVCNATITLISPLPESLDPRNANDFETKKKYPGTAFLIRFPRFGK